MPATREIPGRQVQGGFSLIEILAVLSLIAITMAIAMPSIRQYWFVQSLHGARDDLITEVRSLQARVTAESHPIVFGIRFTETGGWNDLGRWGLVKYDPTGGGSGTPTCVQYALGTSEDGVFSATVDIQNPSFTTAPTTEQTFCRANLQTTGGAPIPASTDEFAFFYARGTATAGTLRLHQSNLDASSDIVLQIYPLTGRIEAL